MISNLIFRAVSVDYFNEVRIAAFVNQGSSEIPTHAAKAATIEIVPLEGTTEAFLSLKPSEAQSLINALYEAGLRPSGVKPQDETIRAIVSHKEELSKLVWEMLPKVLGNKK